MRDTSGNETVLFSIETGDIDATSGLERVILQSIQPEFDVEPTSYFGIRAFATTTRTPSTTISVLIGGNYGAYMNTTLALRHELLRGKNDEAGYQHVTVEERNQIGINQDSIAILDYSNKISSVTYTDDTLSIVEGGNTFKTEIGTSSIDLQTVTENGNSTSLPLSIGKGIGSSTVNIRLGEERTGNGYAYIDFIGDTVYTDYGFRVVRGNSGENTTTRLVHRGEGDFYLEFKRFSQFEVFSRTVFIEANLRPPGSSLSLETFVAITCREQIQAIRTYQV